MKRLWHTYREGDRMLVLLSFLLQKILAFATTLLLAHLLSRADFGRLAIVPAMFAAVVTLSGAGLPVALLKFGSAIADETEKKGFQQIILRKSFRFQFWLSAAFAAAGFLFEWKYPGILHIFLAFAVRLWSSLLMLHRQSEYRIEGRNAAFAWFSIQMAAVGFLAAALGALFFGLNGYLWGIALSPMAALFWFPRSAFRFSEKERKITVPKEVMKFAKHAAVTNFFSELFFSLDLLLLAYFASETAIAEYRVAALIPANLIFLAQSFVQTDYPKLAAQADNPLYFKAYLKKYYLFFLPLTAGLLLCLYLISPWLVPFVFGDKYEHSVGLFQIFLIISAVNMLLRVPFGNLLSAAGHMQAVSFSTMMAVSLLAGLGITLAAVWGVWGMAWAVGISMMVSSGYLARYFWQKMGKS